MCLEIVLDVMLHFGRVGIMASACGEGNILW